MNALKYVYVKQLSGVGQVSVKRTNLSHSRQLFNTLIPTVAGGCSLDCRSFGHA